MFKFTASILVGDLAAGDVQATVAAPGEVGVVGDQHQRGAALAVHLEQQVDHVLAGGRVEVEDETQDVRAAAAEPEGNGWTRRAKILEKNLVTSWIARY